VKRAAAAFRSLLVENWGLKLLSLSIATVLRFVVVGEKRSEVTVTIPLELTGVPDDLVVLSRVPDTVRARLSGPRTLLAGLNHQQLSVVLGLDGAQAGLTRFENLASRIKLPKRVEVTYLSPSSIALELDVKGVKRLRVKPRLRGRPADGLEVARVRVDPPEVEVVGGATLLRRLEEVPTEVVDVSGLDGSVSRPVDLAFPNPMLRPLSREPQLLHIVLRKPRGLRR
jgi:YbbR domain-containing protein